jgi:hypothetical protein
MQTEVCSDTLNFSIAEFGAATMDLDARIFAEKPASIIIYLQIFTLIQALLTAPRLIE